MGDRAMTRNKRIAVELIVGIGTLAILLVIRYDLLHPEFEPWAKVRRGLYKALFERPQREPPEGIWRTPDFAKSPVVFQIPAHDFFFARYQGTESLLLALRTSGRYQVLVREHLGVMVWDEGDWSSTDSGDIALRSEMRYHHLRSDEHWYVMVNESVLADLPALKRDILAFLERSTDSTFSFKDVERIREYPSRYDPNWKYSVFTGNDWEPVSRQSLEDFTGEIDRYLSWSDKNVFHLRPVTYRAYAFLVDLDSEYFSADEQIAGLRDQVDNLTGDKVPVDVYVALTEGMYRYETARTEPFKFVQP